MPDYTQRVREKQGDQLGGETVLGATLVYPPGSALYSTALRGGKAGIVAGPLGSVIAGKASSQDAEGTAGSIPRAWGIVALTERRLLWFKAKPGLSIGPQPKELLLQWPVEQIQSLAFEAKGLGGYPTFVVTFADGSSVLLLSENTHRPAPLAEAWAALRPA